MPMNGNMSCAQRLELDLTDGATVWSGDCDRPPARARVPADAVRRAAFFAALRPHVTLGAERPETVEIPGRLAGREIEFVSVVASILPPYGPERRRTTHGPDLRYRVTLPGGEVSGACFERAYGEYGEAAVCSAMNDLWALAQAP